MDDLILLCQSHHEGYSDLMEAKFNARLVGQPPVAVNLRFLALALRVADILDFDPERTPEVILQHRDIAPQSRIHWYKNEQISLKLDSRHIAITARPSAAIVHKPTEEMTNEIDGELALCQRITSELSIKTVPGCPDEIPYEWTLPAAVQRDIRAREGTYEYIDGAFRPDTKKLLSLLSGSALYGEPMHAVRELIQNAFDAVDELIARQKLRQSNPASPTLAQQLAEQHRVSLLFDLRGPDAYLACTDSGVGMTKPIIQSRVLVSGSGPRHEVRDLDRRCKAAGIRLQRSGQFGIGMLSYFMIARNVDIQTLRAQEAEDSDGVLWNFETSGVGSFGELRKTKGSLHGTRIDLRLNRQISEDPANWYEQLRIYLERTLVYLPCQFQLNSPLPGCQPLVLDPGWSPIDRESVAIEELRQAAQFSRTKESNLLSSADMEKRRAREEETQKVEAEYLSAIRWRRDVGVTSTGSAEYELWTAYFELLGGPSLVFVRPVKDKDKRTILAQVYGGEFHRPRFAAQEAWKGMSISDTAAAAHHRDEFPQTLFRINWVSETAGRITVDRSSLLGPRNQQDRLEISDHHERVMSELREKFVKSAIASLNDRAIARGGPSAKRPCWHVSSTLGGAPAWEEISFPATYRNALRYGVFSYRDEVLFSLRGRPVAVTESLDGGRRANMNWNWPGIPPDVLGYAQQTLYELIPVWATPSKAKEGRLDNQMPISAQLGCALRCAPRTFWRRGYQDNLEPEPPGGANCYQKCVAMEPGHVS